MSFTEAQLEKAIVELLGAEGYTHVPGERIERARSEVLLKDDLKAFLLRRYADEKLTEAEADSVVRQLALKSSADLYESNRAVMKMVSDGLLFKRADRKQKDLHIQLIDYSDLAEHRAPREGEVPTVVGERPAAAYGKHANIYKVVTQLEIEEHERRIPDAILYINGLPLVVFEFKSTVREEATIHDAYVQLAVRYRRDIPELFKYNAFCVISDGINSKAGTLFSQYDYFYAWRKTDGYEAKEAQGIGSLYTMISGMFNRRRLKDIVRNFVLFPDVSNDDVKILCRYPQYYAAVKLYANILKQRRPEGDGKGGTYFGATGCGKSYTMLFLSRLLMKSVDFGSPTIVLITDRTDLDDQLSGLFENAKRYVGDNTVISVKSRAHLRELLKGRESGGVFLTTIHKFTEDTELLTDRVNVICISDEAHRTQTNLDQKISITERGVKRTFGFAKYLHDSLPGATFVGFTGTPVDATLAVFGDVVDAYTMGESVEDEITVRIVYEGRAAKVLLDNSKLDEIEAYYARCADEGASDYQIEESKKAVTQMNAILGDPDRIAAVAEDFVKHYEQRAVEGATVNGKALFVSSSRQIAYNFYREVLKLRPEWGEVRTCEAGAALTAAEAEKIKPMERVKMVMTRGKDDPAELYELLGTKEYRKELDRQFKNDKSNFKIAVVVDMWLTGFDVPSLDTIYIDKPVQRHNLIQTISRVNRKFEGKEKGLVVDYIGIKSQMNLALAQFSKVDASDFEEIAQSVTAVKDHLALLNAVFHKFNADKYYRGTPKEQLETLNRAAEFVQITEELEKRFMYLVKRLKAAYDICCGSEALSLRERDQVHFYKAVRAIVFKLTKGDAPDLAQMNARVKAMIEEAIKSDGVEEIFKLGEDQQRQIDIFDEDYLHKISKIKLPNTKLKLLQKLLSKAVDDFKKVNRAKGMDFSKKLTALVQRYNERKEADVLVSNVLEDFTDEIIDLYHALRAEKESFGDLGINFEEKAFYDILKSLAVKYDFVYPEEKLIPLAKEVKAIVDDKAKYTDWSRRDDIKAELKVDLIMALANAKYPPVDRDEVYKEIFEQAENFKRYQVEAGN